MRRFKKAGLVLLVVLIAIQFIQPAQNNSGGLTGTDITKVFPVPAGVQEALKVACFDCHSNHTRYPWYARVQPFGWLLARHIREGKSELNFSAFGSYSLRRQVSKLKAAESSIKEGSMPLRSYTLMHADARLSAGQKAAVTAWLSQTRDSLATRRGQENTQKETK